MKNHVIRLFLIGTFSFFYVFTFAQNVGIGVPLPLAKLHIQGTANISQLMIDASSTQSNNYPIIKLRNSLIVIDAPQVDRIYLMHELFPDIASLIKDENNSNNYFETTLSPSLGYVSFKGIDFNINGESISCLPNYVIPFDNIKYVKEN